MKNFLPSILVLCAIILSSCNKTTSVNQSGTYTFTDDYGRIVEVPQSPQRVVSISPAITEIIFALGAQDILVGRTDFCEYPTETQKIESVGGISNLNIEKVISLCPDLVISGSMVPEKVVDVIDKAGIPLVCVIEKNHFDGLYENIEKIGLLIGKQTQAKCINDSLKTELNKLDIKESKKKPTIYYVVGFGKSGNFTAGGNTFINDILQIAGTQNVAKDINGWDFSLESLLKADPEYIVIRTEDMESFIKTPPYNQLTAVKNGNIIPIESAYLDLQTPRNIEAILLINKATHNQVTK